MPDGDIFIFHSNYCVKTLKRNMIFFYCLQYCAPIMKNIQAPLNANHYRIPVD